MDDERGRAVGRRLDGEREHDERRDPPLPQDDADERDRRRRRSAARRRRRRSSRSATHPSAPAFGARRASVHVFVGRRRSPQTGSSTRVTKKPSPIESAAIDSEAGDHHDDEDDRRMEAGRASARAARPSPPRGCREPERSRRWRAATPRARLDQAATARVVFPGWTCEGIMPTLSASTASTVFSFGKLVEDHRCRYFSSSSRRRRRHDRRVLSPGATRGRGEQPAATPADAARKVGETVGRHSRGCAPCAMRGSIRRRRPVSP